MKLSCGVQKSEAGEFLRRTIAFLATRMAFRQNGELSGFAASKDELPDQMHLVIEGVPVSLIVADDLHHCPGFVLIKAGFVDDTNLMQALALNPVLLSIHNASFAWCSQSESFVLTRLLPQHLVYDEDDVFDFMVDSVRLLGRCEEMLSEECVL